MSGCIIACSIMHHSIHWLRAYVVSCVLCMCGVGIKLMVARYLTYLPCREPGQPACTQGFSAPHCERLARNIRYSPGPMSRSHQGASWPQPGQSTTAGVASSGLGEKRSATTCAPIAACGRRVSRFSVQLRSASGSEAARKIRVETSEGGTALRARRRRAKCSNCTETSVAAGFVGRC